jgi:2-dehydropantoate 2-reductase
VSDLVIVGLKTTANDQLPALLTPLVGPSTLVLTLQNGLGNVERLAALFPPNHILGGLCFICVNRLAPGHIRHLAYGRVVLGDYGRTAQPRTQALARLFQQARVQCEVTDNLARAQWEKLIWNIPFNGLGVAGTAGYEAVCAGELGVSGRLNPCLTTDQLLADPRWEALARELMAEVIRIGRALGHDLADPLAEENIQRTRTMGPYQASTLLDFEKGIPLEVESIFLQPLRHAQKLGLQVPRLEAMCRLLLQLNR